jgi:RNA polymerase sigma-70 factor (ECF subfamily)
MSRPSDQLLMLRAKEGDTDAFELLVERHKDMVYGVCFSVLRSRQDSEEAAQDTFLKLFRKRDLYDENRALEPWLLRIAGNTSRDMARRRRATSLPGTREQQGQSALELVEDSRLSMRRQQDLTGQAVRQEIERMSERIRVPLELRYLNGLTNVEIAQVMGISLSSVKQRLARGKDLLQSRLAGVVNS